MNCWVWICVSLGLVLFVSSEEDVGERLGLLGTSLGLDPLGSIADGKNTDGSEDDLSAPLISLDDPFETIPDEMDNMNDGSDYDLNGNEVSIENFENKCNESNSNGFFNTPDSVQSDKLTEGLVPEQHASSPQCCCVPHGEVCEDPLGSADLVSAGLLDDRLSHTKPVNSSSIIFRLALSPAQLPPSSDCPLGMRACCYPPDLSLTTFGISCLTPEEGRSPWQWQQGCLEDTQEEVVAGTKQCGTRSFPGPAQGVEPGLASPGEFPWTCMVLTKENGFVGNCAIIPGKNGTTKSVITAAHKLNKIVDGR